ncbi:hypothetical protein [Aminobacter carboxidus]|uniref:Uncharacterized protein n=1 Tax=Aminobacter carboxidus TaxID=376165 RepID=A0ABR9GU94_9HYPH|nr:hypothetical protein [Aminobacter carboxidus]MBE1207232.1 hypothetical protein [Aminobacter carboxidus]
MTARRAVGLSEAGWLEAASRSLDALAPELKGYQPYHAARAELLSRKGNFSQAAAAYAIAIELASSVSDSAFLRRRAGHLAGRS